MSSDDLIKQTYAVEHALETAMGGIHNSQEWGEPWTAPYANGHGSYGAWIEAEFQKLRDMAMSNASLVEENKRMREALEEIKSYSSMVRKSNILSSPFEDRTRRDIWVKARYEVGKKIYEMARSALGDTNA